MNILMKREKEINMCEEGLGISLNDVTIVNDAKLKALQKSTESPLL